MWFHEFTSSFLGTLCGHLSYHSSECVISCWCFGLVEKPAHQEGDSFRDNLAMMCFVKGKWLVATLWSALLMATTYTHFVGAAYLHV